MRLTFNAKTVRSNTGVGMHFDDGDPGLEFAVPAAEIEAFLREFRAGTQLTVQFPDANFPDCKAAVRQLRRRRRLPAMREASLEFVAR